MNVISDYLLNEIHTIDLLTLCGCLPDNSVDMILADLPFGTTQCSWDVVIPFEPMWEQFRRVIKPRGAIVLFGSQPFSSLLTVSNLEWFRYEIINDKRRPTRHLDSKHRPLLQHDNILVFAESGPDYYPMLWESGQPKSSPGTVSKGAVYGKCKAVPYKSKGEKYPRSVISYGLTDYERGLHPTQKAIALHMYLIEMFTQTGAVALDPVCGSGTTAIAAKSVRRNFICGDSSHEYTDVARKRINKAIQISLLA